MPRKKAEKLNRSHGGTNKQCFQQAFLPGFGNSFSKFHKSFVETSLCFKHVLKQDAESSLVHVLVFDDKNKQSISNDKHVLQI